MNLMKNHIYNAETNTQNDKNEDKITQKQRKDVHEIR